MFTQAAYNAGMLPKDSPYVMFGFLAITFEIFYIRTITLTARDDVRARLEAILGTLLPEAWHPSELDPHTCLCS